MLIFNNPALLTKSRPKLVVFSGEKFEIKHKILFLSKIASTIELVSINNTKNDNS